MLQNCLPETYPSDSFDYIVDMAEKGFMLLAYAVLELKEEEDYQGVIGRRQFSFLGFLVLQQARAE